MTEIASLGDIMRRMPSELHARRFLERLIWPSGRLCPHCGGMESAAIAGPAARPGLYPCRHRECRRQFTITTCTPMHGTKLDLRTWIMAIFYVLSTSKGVSSVALARTIGVNQKTAWKMGHAIRQMMIAHDDVCGRLDGEVEADEAFVGGEPKFKSGEAPHKRGRGTGKPIVLMAVSRLQRQVRAELIPAATTAVVDPLLREWITSRSTLNTDGSTIYDAVGLKFDAHLKVNHREREYADRKSGATTNTAEAFAANIERARETRSCNPISRSPE